MGDYTKYIEQINKYIFDATPEAAELAINLLLTVCEEKSDTYRSTIPLKGEFEGFKKAELSGLGIKGKFAEIQIRLLDIFNAFKDEISNSNYDSLENKIDDSIDPIFKLLSKIDFNPQEDKFNYLVNDRNFLIFVIRGDGVCGQRWLLRQLIDNYSVNHDYLIYHLEDQNFDANRLIEAMMNELGCKLDKNRFELKCKKVIDALLKRSKTKNQFIILKKTFNFIHSETFKYFFDSFLDGLNIGKNGNDEKYKIVVIFVEETIVPYNIENLDITYLEKVTDINSHKKFITDWKNRNEYIKIIGLHPIGTIDVVMLNNWLSNYAALLISDNFFPEFEKSTTNFFAECCAGGNPEQVLYHISKKLKYEDKWLKY